MLNVFTEMTINNVKNHNKLAIFTKKKLNTVKIILNMH